VSERYGDYQLLRHIATGGMAEIHLARQGGVAGVSRLVIVKRMLPQLAVRPDFVTMFQDEARLTSTLEHPNIVRVHELGKEGGSYFIAMELIDGPHLGALFAHSLRARTALPLDLCCWIVARAADGLHYAHDRDDPATGEPLHLVHRDISPQNILVGRHGEVKVTDFGVAKASTQQTKTRTGIIKGKVAYMSPEQCLGETIDRRTDVFALGIVLYELVTRRRLFHHLKSDLLVMQEITSKDIPRASTANATIDAQLDEILTRALARDARERYPTALALAEALDAWLGGRVNERTLADWFERNCASLAPSTQTPEVAPAVVDAAPVVPLRAEATSATPSMPEIEIPRATALSPQAKAQAGLPEATVVSAPPRAMLVHAQRGTLTSSVSSALDGALDGATVRVDVAPGLAPMSPPRSRWPRAAAAIAAAVIAAGGVAAIGVRVMRGADDPPTNATSTTTAPPSTPSAPSSATGRVHVETTPAGVTIIAGESRVLGKSPVDAELPPGPVHLQAQFADQPPRAVDVVVAAGTTTNAAIHAWVPVVVRSTPSKAKVRLDGALRGETPFEQGFLVEPGKAVTVRLEAPGYASYDDQRVAEPGVPLEMNVKLTPSTSTAAPSGGTGSVVAAPSEFGAIRVNVDPWANVRLGDAFLGEAPFNDKRVRAGRQTLTLTNPEMGLTDAFPVVVPANKTLVVILRYEKKGTAWVLAQKIVR
jgi:serine/threonine-protein kinase